jgi:hypothetical protein
MGPRSRKASEAHRGARTANEGGRHVRTFRDGEAVSGPGRAVKRHKPQRVRGSGAAHTRIPLPEYGQRIEDAETHDNGY